VYEDGSFYEGDFREDFAYGKGIFSFISGDKYEGDFMKD